MMKMFVGIYSLTMSVKAVMIDIVDHFILVQIILRDDEEEGKHEHRERSCM